MTASTTTIAARLENLAGASHVLAQPADCEGYLVDSVVPAAVVRPASPEEVSEIVRFAASEKLAVIASGARTKLGLGMPPARYDIALDMTGLRHIAHYDPGDLTLSVDAGMPLATLNAALNEHKQFLPLLVPYYSQTTVGGAIASGVGSPLRQFYGTARDFVIGAEFVTGSGALAKSGGRVVKNVTGYDLHKLLIGSLGTLAVIIRVNFRTFPAPPASRGFVASFPTAEGALALRRRIAQSALTPLTLDLLNPELAQIFAAHTPSVPEPAVFAGEDPAKTSLAAPGDWFHSRDWQLCAAFGGTPEVLDRYARDLSRFAAESRATSTAVLDDATRPIIWGRLRESLSLLRDASPAATIFKISLLPEQHAAAFTKLREIAGRASLPHALVARAAGTLYFALLPDSANEETLRSLTRVAQESFSLAQGFGGSAMLLFAPLCVKTQVNVWGPSRPDFPLMQRVKNSFDPAGILAPGRFCGGL